MHDKKNHTPSLRFCADWGLMAEFGSTIDPELNSWTRLVAQRLQKLGLPGITEIVPAYSSFLVIYNPLELAPSELQQAILDISQESNQIEHQSGTTVQIPVCYQGEYAPDIETVAQINNLSVQEVIQIHSSTEYLIYMLGFAPGFPYLGGLDKRLHTPRLETPRELVPAGSVGIAGSQTGIYPLASPGGWRIIGRTGLKLFDANQDNPVPYYAPGDKLKFCPVSQAEFQYLLQEQNHA